MELLLKGILPSSRANRGDMPVGGGIRRMSLCGTEMGMGWCVRGERSGQNLRDGSLVVVCHYPTGASKYYPIEYRLFSQITRNWAGQPLRSFDIMLNDIRSTTPRLA